MLQRGAVLSGKYRIDGVLGEGGMAVVYAVTHLRNNARRAVKVLHEGSARKGNVRARFVREGKVANSVNHPGAVQMIDDGIADDGAPYLVMEHLNGVSVDELSSRGIPLSAALNIAYQVLDVLRAAHDNGIIHRDIKPANLFVLRNGRVKVLDFGISRLHDGAEPFDSQATGSVMGTPFFMAPEQARADASAIDTRTDLFAVGATLFTMISGKYLYTGDDSRQVMIQAATQPARSLDSVAPGAPGAVVDLVAKAVAYDAAARWPNAQAMQEAVRQVHEALCGPLEADSLATLVLAREFRRKSHARLTSQSSPVPWSLSHAEPSPLSTTLPAVAVSTRSVDSYRATHDSASRISAEPNEFAGWTGQVLAPVSASANGKGLRLARILSKARFMQIGVAALVVGGALFGFARSQTPEHVASKAAPSLDVTPPIVVRSAETGVKVETAEFTAPALRALALTAEPGRAPAPVRIATSKTAQSTRPAKTIVAPPPAPPATATNDGPQVPATLMRTHVYSTP